MNDSLPTPAAVRPNEDGAASARAAGSGRIMEAWNRWKAAADKLPPPTPNARASQDGHNFAADESFDEETQRWTFGWELCAPNWDRLGIVFNLSPNVPDEERDHRPQK